MRIHREPVSGSTSCCQVHTMRAAFATSTAATISCCTRYPINLTPVPGATGLVTFITPMPGRIFPVGPAFTPLASPALETILWKAFKEHIQCAHI
jgi:hypothetical protein